MRDFAASGVLVAAPMPPEKRVILAHSPGSGPTKLAPRHGHDFRSLRDAEFGFTLGHDFRRLGARHQDALSLHLLGDPEPVEDTGEINPARAALRGISIDDRLGSEQRT